MKTQIEAVCKKFRITIEDIVSKDGIPYFDYYNIDFPHGACGDTSLLLGKFFYEHFDIDCSYVHGQYTECTGDMFILRTHSWLEYSGYKIDITADQFDDDISKVLVIEQHEFYERFEVDKTEAISSKSLDKLTDTYELIKERVLNG
ncbi:hypothetical protein NBRC13296_12280 [Paenibacillus chitinolyticus]|uniref:hypothetical protein n=1 Tax=Paenibacillus chitinolyticus TaxID=79263 RepID=UPI00355641FF